MNVAVVDSGANLVAFQRMDGAQLASIAIVERGGPPVGPPAFQRLAAAASFRAGW